MAVSYPIYETDAEGKTHIVGREVRYEGRVLCTRERNGYDDSDFYAVYLGEDGQLHEEEYATTRTYTYDNHASVDASEEVLVQAERALADWAYYRMKHDDLRKAREITVGKRVRVTGGRKHKGAEGTVTWEGVVHAAYSKWSEVRRARILPDEGEAFFVDSYYVEVIEPESLLEDEEYYLERAWRYGKTRCWHAPFCYGMLTL